MDRSHHFSGKERSVMLNHLARASEARGTDATGIAYNSRKRMRVYKRPMAAHRLRLKVPEDAVTVIGHTRLTTQGSARFNENNHPWRCQISTGPFALAHNGVLYNDTALRRELALPTPKIQTDSYIAVQIIEQQRTLSFDSLKTMAEQVEGSFAFSVLDHKDRIYLVKGDNPLCLYYFPSFDLYLYASTQAILNDALTEMPFCLGKAQEIRLTCGDIVLLCPDAKPEKQTFDTRNLDFPYWGHFRSSYSYFWPTPEPTYSDYEEQTNYMENLKTAAGAYGYTPDDIDYLLSHGYSPEDVEDMLYCYAGY